MKNHVKYFWMCIFQWNLVYSYSQKLQTDRTVVHAASLLENVLEGCYSYISSASFNQFLPLLQNCLQNGSLLVLDKMQDSEAFELLSGIQFVDNRKVGKIADFNYSSDTGNANNYSWKKKLALKFNRLLHSHNLKVRLSLPSDFENNSENEARRRHHGQMMPLIMFATVALGMVLIPMGFQFLAVLGGKALLLAKMALILSSIQGLKKIASSNVNYGLYQNPDRC